ncbi:MAG TPA: serine hydrolase domain-containing protein [Polyangia bacterium]
MGRTFEPLRRLCHEAVDTGVVPGAVVLFIDEGEPRFHEAFGSRQLEPVILPASRQTIYDVASLTKAIVTSVLCMRAVETGRLRLDSPVVTYLPELSRRVRDADAQSDRRPDQGASKEAVTVRHLLSHSAGLPAHRPFYLSPAIQALPPAERRAAIQEAAASEPLIAPPGTRAVYTDLGFITLGWLLERVCGARLDQLAEREIFGPLGLATTAFGPLAATPEREIAATERCPWRGQLLVGEVHDQNTWAMGGVAGHAGLFSTAADLAVIARALVAAWRGDRSSGGAGEHHGPLVDRDVIREFWTPSGIPGSNWRLGWDGPAATGSQAGERLARSAVGHLGFTGCSLWIDPARERVIVLLSNRVHPTVRDDPRFRAFRPAVQDAAIEG